MKNKSMRSVFTFGIILIYFPCLAQLVLVQGKVVDANLQGVSKAIVSIQNYSDKEISVVTDSSGYFSIPIDKLDSVKVRVEAKGFLFAEKFMKVIQNSIGYFELVPLRVIRCYRPLLLFFKLNSLEYTDTLESTEIIRLLVDILKNEQVVIEVHGNCSEKELNPVPLSDARAKKIAQKLIQEGIDSNRIILFPHGISRPIHIEEEGHYNQYAEVVLVK